KAAQDYEKHLEWYPKECLKSRMRQSRTYGSVRGGGSNASRLLDLLSYRATRSVMVLLIAGIIHRTEYDVKTKEPSPCLTLGLFCTRLT
ncbi:MAG: hypothetical protein IKM84_06780, partial [Oscillospiraceae bacterium]|nr:hypothetical protein [Oscillospiraceae bacterium]